MELLGV